MTKSRQIIYGVLVLFLGSLVTMGSYAFFTWSSANDKIVSFNTAKELQEYIVYDEGESQFSGEFKVSSTYTQGIHSTIGISKTSDAANVNLVATINMDVNQIGANMKESTALKWVVTEGTTTNVGNVLARGNFVGVNADDTMMLVPSLLVSTTEQKYTIWIWLDSSEDPSDSLSGEILDVDVWTQIDQVEGVTDVYEITKISANYQTISATVVNNQHKVTDYAITNTNSQPSSWTSIPTTEQANVYNLVDSTTATTTGTYYVWFKDEEDNVVSEIVNVTTVDTTAPTCNFGSWSKSSIQNSETATIELTCTDSESAITNNNLTVSDLTKSNNSLNITNVAKTSVTNGYKYTITVTGTTTDGDTTITLPADKIKNAMHLGNAAKASSSIQIANTYTVTYQKGNNNCTLNPTTYAVKTATYNQAYSIANPSCTGYTFTGWSATGLDTTNAKYGDGSANTSWTNGATPVKGTSSTYFNNLAPRSTKTVP